MHLKPALTNSANRRRWKLQVLKSLSIELGISVADIRRIIGKLEFDEIVNAAYCDSAANPEKGTKLVREVVLRNYGAALGCGIDLLNRN